jgi:hypothetical protein
LDPSHIRQPTKRTATPTPYRSTSTVHHISTTAPTTPSQPTLGSAAPPAAAYCDDVRICAPLPVALAAYRRLKRLARERLGCVEVPAKGSVIWEGEMSEVDSLRLSMLPACMPGRSSRLLHDKQLGVLVGDSRPESVAAVKAALQAKFEDKATLMTRMRILTDPQVSLG